MNLKARVERLEKLAGVGQDLSFVMLVLFGRDKVTRFRSGDRVIARLPDEDFEVFRERAKRWALANNSRAGNCVAMLMAECD